MPKLASKNGRSARLASSTTKYDAHHTVLSKTYGALADLRRELADPKSRVAEREEILRIFSTRARAPRRPPRLPARALLRSARARSSPPPVAQSPTEPLPPPHR